MRSFLLLNLLSNAAGSVAEDPPRSGPSRGTDNRVRENHLRSRGLSSSWQRVPGQASPFVPEVVPEAVEDVVEDVLEDTNDEEKDIVIVYEEEDDGEEEAIAVLFKDFEGEDEIIAGMAAEGHDTTKEKVRWTKGRNRRGGPNNKRRGPRGAGDAPKGRKEGQRKKGKEKTPATVGTKSSAPTVAPTSVQVVDAVNAVDAIDAIDAVDAIDAGDVSTSDPATVPPEPANSTPKTDDVFSWTESTPTESTPSTVPACPPHYSASVTYVAGDTVEEYSRIYECQPAPYEAYCNIVELDESWDDAQKKLWKDAWARVSDCEKTAVEEEVSEDPVEHDVLEDLVEDEVFEDPVEDEVSEDLIANTATATEAPMAIKTPRPPPCPSDYDASRTTYAAGDRVTVKSHVFKCSEETGYETYCNIAVWDDGLSAENEEAKEMWTHAWEDMGACEPTHEELMEEEAGA